MITIAHVDGYYRAVVFNEFTLQDFQEFEDCVLSAAKRGHDSDVGGGLRDMADIFCRYGT